MGLIGKLNIRRIKNMEVGETGYALATLALAFDIQGKPYLNLSAPIYEKISTMMHLPVTHTGPKKTDYDVDISDISYDLVKSDSEGNPFGRLVKDEDVVELYYNNPLDAITNEEIEQLTKFQKPLNP